MEALINNNLMGFISIICHGK